MFCSFLVSSCSKNNFREQVAIDQKENKTTNNISAPEQLASFSISPNPLNPNDFVGKRHNTFLKNLKKYDGENDSISYKKIKELADKSIKSNYPSATSNSKNTSLDNLFGKNKLFIDYDLENRKEEIISLYYSGKNKDVILNYVSKCSSINYENLSLFEIEEMLLSYENDISSSDTAFLNNFYTISSICRYSALYHSNIFRNGDFPQRSIWRVILADLLGGAIGVAVGGSVGSYIASGAATFLD